MTSKFPKCHLFDEEMTTKHIRQRSKSESVYAPRGSKMVILEHFWAKKGTRTYRIWPQKSPNSICMWAEKRGHRSIPDLSTSHHYEYVSDHGIRKNAVSRSVFAMVFWRKLSLGVTKRWSKRERWRTFWAQKGAQEHPWFFHESPLWVCFWPRNSQKCRLAIRFCDGFLT